MNNAAPITTGIMNSEIEELKLTCIQTLQRYDDLQQEFCQEKEKQDFFTNAYDSLESLYFKLTHSDRIFFEELRNNIRMELKCNYKMEMVWQWEKEDAVA
jgi:hypothetical protein